MLDLIRLVAWMTCGAMLVVLWHVWTGSAAGHGVASAGAAVLAWGACTALAVWAEEVGR